MTSAVDTGNWTQVFYKSITSSCTISPSPDTKFLKTTFLDIVFFAKCVFFHSLTVSFALLICLVSVETFLSMTCHSLHDGLKICPHLDLGGVIGVCLSVCLCLHTTQSLFNLFSGEMDTFCNSSVTIYSNRFICLIFMPLLSSGNAHSHTLFLIMTWNPSEGSSLSSFPSILFLILLKSLKINL